MIAIKINIVPDALLNFLEIYIFAHIDCLGMVFGVFQSFVGVAHSKQADLILLTSIH